MQNQQFRLSDLGQLHRRCKNRCAIFALQRTLPDDNHAAFLVGVIHGQQVFNRRATIAKFDNGIGQISGRTDPPHRGTSRPRLADAGVEHRRFLTRVRPDQKDHLRFVDILDPRIANIGRAIAGGQFRPVSPAFDNTALPFDQLFKRISRFNRCQIADKARQL